MTGRQGRGEGAGDTLMSLVGPYANQIDGQIAPGSRVPRGMKGGIERIPVGGDVEG